MFYAENVLGSNYARLIIHHLKVAYIYPFISMCPFIYIWMWLSVSYHQYPCCFVLSEKYTCLALVWFCRKSSQSFVPLVLLTLWKNVQYSRIPLLRTKQCVSACVYVCLSPFTVPVPCSPLILNWVSLFELLFHSYMAEFDNLFYNSLRCLSDIGLIINYIYKCFWRPKQVGPEEQRTEYDTKTKLGTSAVLFINRVFHIFLEKILLENCFLIILKLVSPLGVLCLQ